MAIPKIEAYMQGDGKRTGAKIVGGKQPTDAKTSR